MACPAAPVARLSSSADVGSGRRTARRLLLLVVASLVGAGAAWAVRPPLVALLSEFGRLLLSSLPVGALNPRVFL